MPASRRPCPFLPSRARLAASLLALAAVLSGCGEKADDPATLQRATLARERAAAYAEKTEYGRAREELAPLATGDDATTDDLLRAAAIEFALSENEAAGAFLDRVVEREPRSPAAHYLRGQMARDAGESEQALEHLRIAHEEAPSDDPTTYALAIVLHDLDQKEEAEALYRQLLERGIENAGAWYVAALYRLERLMYEEGRDEDADELYVQRQALLASGVPSPSEAPLRLGTFGKLSPPPRRGSTTVPRETPITFTAAPLDLPGLRGATWLAAHDMDWDGRMDALAVTPRGVVAAMNTADGWREEVIAEGGVALARAFEADDDATVRWLEVLVAREGSVSVLTRAEGGWRPVPGDVPGLPSTPVDAIAVDFDHEGDLDLLLVGDFGARLWRNDAAAKAGGAFTDVSVEAGLPGKARLTWCTTEDLDGDNDVDLLFGGPAGPRLADSLRGGRFDLRPDAFAGSAFASRPIVADFDGDSRPDLWLPGRPSSWLRQGVERRYTPVETQADVPASPALVDLDRDGAADLVWDGGALLAPGQAAQRPAGFEGWPAAPGGALCWADLDGDHDYDALRVQGDEVLLLTQDAGPYAAKELRLRGTKDNIRAAGAIVEVCLGPIYRRIYYRGEEVLVGAGEHESIDVLRIRWPNGVVQTELDVPVHELRNIQDPTAELTDFIQSEGLVGSCPFLYAWNGETYEFISDVLGITPLGLPMAPGQYVPPDHDEYVLVRGDQLVPRDGRYELQFTEELREVTYLDRARLEVVDHPEGTEIFPNERFTFPPFPEPHTHTVRGALAPLRAIGSDGRDWADELAREDDVHAVPFTPLRSQFQGLAEPWFLELAFDPEAVRGAKKLRLVMTGWFRWTNASVNLAVARTPEVAFVPPVLQVLTDVADNSAESMTIWTDAGPPVGFPAGKPKTMVIDVSQLDLARNPRLRVFTTLQLHWDRIALAVDDDDAELRVTQLEPVEARLWERGFSAPLPVERPDTPERFDWERLVRHPRWDQHPGAYTRHGDCLELVGAVDDRYAILGAGDALTLAFDATAVPPCPEGFVRDYLLFLDGWAKDRDPNTTWAQGVEPLPFHGMSGYPYGKDERFPDDEAHERWRREWNTRPARQWVEELAPLLEGVER